ncbi:hypothetical protein BD779DRAFT_1513570 [Infundibulicybe gibba]|nr:hypothetical protein BD779DRAFT_1513570 [Infundibulicybe gibba]
MSGDNQKDDAVFKQLRKHDKYYIEGGDFYILAGNTHFRVHRYFFERESGHFSRIWKNPPATGAKDCPGSSESNALTFGKTTAEDLSRFLMVFYNETYDIYNASLEDWSVILRLANQWKFKEVKNLAVRQIERLEMTEIERIVLYQAQDVDPTLLIPLYSKLCSSPQPLTDDEVDALGLKTASMIFRARERLRAKASDGGKSPLPNDLKQERIFDTIRELAGIPPPTKDKTKLNGTTQASGTSTGSKKSGTT